MEQTLCMGCEEGWVPRWKVEYICIPLDAFHFLLLRAKAIRQGFLEKELLCRLLAFIHLNVTLKFQLLKTVY